MIGQAVPEARGAGAATVMLRRLGTGVAAVVLSERERWPLWVPVLLGAGIGGYFALPAEPAHWSGIGASAICLAVTLASRRRPALMLAALAGLLVGAGFAAAQLRSHLAAAPVLDGRYGPAPVFGLVVQVEDLAGGPRVTLEQVALEGFSPERTPQRVRVKLRRGDRAAVGARIEVFAKLSQPFAPAAPGAYDFQRSAWFRGLGGTGFALGPVRPAAGKGVSSLRLRLAGLRHRMAERIRGALPGQTGAIAAALMTGDRSAISERSLHSMRDSGLAHLLAISGLHLGLVAATLFFGLRAVLALSERLALRHPIKKWAAAAAIVGSFGYLLLAGAPVPTQRAFLMTGLVLTAILLDREAISMRLVAWAAVVVLLMAPESLLGASFQMSFAAVVALVAFYEAARGRLQNLRSGWPGGLVGRVVFYAGGVATTTVIASVATGLIGLHHFGRIAVYGLPANILAVPITALWTMPWAVIAALLMPFGLEGAALAAMGWGIDAVLWVASGVAGWPGAVRHVPAMPVAGLVMVALGGLWVCLWARGWRYLGLVAVLAGVMTVPLNRGPDIILSGDAKLMAARLSDGRLSLSDRRRNQFMAGIWLERNGQSGADVWPAGGSSPDASLSCDTLGCSYRAAGLEIALLRDGHAIDEDCRRADVLVSAVPVRGRCPNPFLVIDRFDLWRGGSTALWVDREGVRVRTVADKQGNRPWSSLARRRHRAPYSTPNGRITR
jgi:competence protein ComEC